MKFYTLSTNIVRTKYLLDSALLYDISFNVIVPKIYRNNTDKIKLMYDELVDVPDDTIICFVDAFDVMVNDNAATIEQKFKDMNCEFLLSAELNCHPAKYRNSLDQLPSIGPYKYPNSGGYIAYCGALKRVLTWNSNIEQYNRSDQAYFIDYYLTNKTPDAVNIKLDFECNIFQCMYNVPKNSIDVRDGIMYKGNKRFAFIHFNGRSFSRKNNVNIMSDLSKAQLAKDSINL